MKRSISMTLTLVSAITAQAALLGCGKHDDATSAPADAGANASAAMSASTPASDSSGTAGGMAGTASAPMDSISSASAVAGSNGASAAAASASDATQAAIATPVPEPAKGSSDASAKLSIRDISFLKDVAEGGTYEIQASGLAADHADNADVKTFATRMIADHTQAGIEAAAFANAHGITLPTTTKVTKKAQYAELEHLKGKNFDKRYIQDVGLDDHKSTIAEFEKESAQTHDVELKAWVDKTLPTLRDHYGMAQHLAQMLKG